MKKNSNICDQVHEQICMLIDYCDLYDTGKRSHAKSMAVRLAAIFDEVLQSPAGANFIKERGVAFASILAEGGWPSLGYVPAYHSPVAVLGISSDTARFLPYCSAKNMTTTMRRFGKWWPEPVFTSHNQKVKITRRFICTQMRNKDGGAHGYDTPLKQYIDVALSNVGWENSSQFSDEITPLGLHFAMIRHISHEALTSLLPVLCDYTFPYYNLQYCGLDKDFIYVLPPLLLANGSPSADRMEVTVGAPGQSATYSFEWKITGSR
jgi:hypothetical protein